MRFILTAIMAIFISGCVSQKNPEIAALINKKEIRVGVEANFKPLIFKDGKHLIGIEPELALRVGKIAGAKIVFYECPWNDLIPALEAGRIDVIMSGMTITPERAKKVDFTTPYIRVGQMALMRTNDIGDFSSADKIINTSRKIGFIQGTTGDYFVKAKCPKSEKLPFKETTDGMKALSNKMIDVFIIDAPVVWEMSNPKLTPLMEPLTEEYLGWAVRKNDKAMLDGLNKCMEQMKNEGTLQAIKKKWIPELLWNL
ncbi:MAG TPA: hypothetical protein DET40_25590 [Lentisphaeria bacterium]|nr:MAG: hypothetical protein A2X45_04735 [Lentisphaerae bacterium GWF2_50_93]HCE46934.1 hypothetical protein [Lentisphaeria bacterium]